MMEGKEGKEGDVLVVNALSAHATLVGQGEATTWTGGQGSSSHRHRLLCEPPLGKARWC